MKRRIPELDGLRAWMIFVVSWYHIWQQSWLRPSIGSYSLDYLVRSGYIWVDGTVLLSAFLLFLPYARAHRSGSPLPDTRQFYARRVRRVLPSYYFILLLVFFAVALPWGLYQDGPFLVKDLATHFTFTFTFFYDTYVATPLGAACWTLAIEVQAYLLFPLIARASLRWPVRTAVILLLICFGFRAWCLWALTEYTMVVNQLLNFLDVYVTGMLAARLYLRLEAGREARQGQKKQALLWSLLMTVLFFAFGFALVRMLRLQAGSNGYDQIQAHQMMYRPVFALLFAGLVVTAPFAARPLRALLGNPVTRFLSAISMNYYLIHQTITVHMKRLHFPASLSETPHMAGEQPWQNQYTFWAFALSLAAAILITFLVEKPAARALEKRFTSSASA